jgi:hypothetical protein
MPALNNRPMMVSIFALSWLAGCASAPPVNSLATVAVQGTVTPGDLQASHSHAIRMRTALQVAGISAEVISAGRVVRVACATMSDGTWGGLGVLPEGARAANDSVWRIRVMDTGDNDREAVNPLTDHLPALTRSGKSAYTFVPNWREQGRFSNLDPVPLPSDQVGRYHVVFSRYLVRCSD